MPAPRTARRRSRATSARSGYTFPFDWRVIANGRLDELLYERGVIDTSRPFPEVRQATLIDARAEAADQDPQFSARIRAGLHPSAAARATGGHELNPNQEGEHMDRKTTG